jgi:predicted Zn-dependent peptidase
MTLNRKIEPDFKVVEKIDIPTPVKVVLDNGIETYIIKSGTQDVVKIELIFNAGSWFQKQVLVASCANEMLMEGTSALTSRQIAEKLDFYGAFIHTQPTKDFGNVSLYTLRKYLPETIAILKDIVINPVYEQKELTTFLNRRKQNFQVELAKVSSIARREFNEQLFGTQHPYGQKAELADYSNVDRNNVVEFHKAHYHPGNCRIFISGKVADSDIELLNKTLGDKNWQSNDLSCFNNLNIGSFKKSERIILKEGATQSAIRLGKLVINRDHPDYFNLDIVNTILGGYFGSRLMKTIREEKGYTYGINSVLVSLKNACYFVILTEVNAEVTKNAVSDILFEMKKLRTEKVSIKELELVKNYMLGHLLRSFDGVFEISSNIRNLIDLNLDVDFYNRMITSIKDITPTEVMDIANKYLHEDSLVKTIVGKY